MLTVLMATHNGAHTLPRVLESYCQLDSPRGGWRLVIVDNGSKDSTRQIIETFASRLPISYHFAARLGKNVALNSGLQLIEGDIVVLTDDDAIPRSDWLAQARQLADSQLTFSVFGGVILPHWESPPPDWILPFQYPTLTVTNPTLDEGPVPHVYVYGPNMVIRAAAFQAGHRFDESLGPTGSRYQMGDETEFLGRLAAAGFSAWHSKKLVVWHIIRNHQMRKDWMLRRGRAAARAEYRAKFLAGPRPVPLLMGWPRYMLREILQRSLRAGWSALFRDETTAFRDRWRLTYSLGRAIEARDLHKSYALGEVASNSDARRTES